MATPEWEEADVQGDWGDDFHPDWAAVDLGGYHRPQWFVQGPLVLCALNLAALNGKNPQFLVFSAFVMSLVRKHVISGFTENFIRFLRLGSPRFVVGRTLKLGLHLPAFSPRPGTGIVVWLCTRLRRFEALLRRLKAGFRKTDEVDRLIAEFDAAFPDRPDRLSREDIALYLANVRLWRRIFRHYDIVQCYATDPILPLLAEKRPYVAFEHGTLRHFILDDVPLHRLTALAYRKSDHTFVTNGDCLAVAERLGLPRFSAMIHPIDVDLHEREAEDSEDVRATYGADVLLICPIRHDWKTKGIDIHLHALPLIKARAKGRVVLLLTEWGQQVADSRALIRELGCEDNVVWLRPLCRAHMVRLTKAADVMLDQMAFPHFGATAPQALAAGTPVIMSYKPESTMWIVDEAAPILSAFTPQEVADRVMEALDPAWRAAFRPRAREWIYRHHHPDRIVREHLRVYRKLLEDTS